MEVDLQQYQRPQNDRQYRLLVLGRSPLPTWTYLRGSGVAWLVVSAMTVSGLTLVLSHRPRSRIPAAPDQRLSARVLLDLAPMFLGASAIRALLWAGITLHGGFVAQLAEGSLFAASVNNLPAAAAVHGIGASGTWAAAPAMAIGPNVFITGSVATLICRRIARDGGISFGVAAFSLLGVAVVPLQLLAATAGLHATGVVR